jgi:hypothetical protein
LILAGYTNSPDGDVQDPIEGYDGWVVRLTPAGEIRWEKSYGGSLDDGFNTIVNEAGSYSIGGSSSSSDGDVPENQGNADCWVVQLSTDVTGIGENCSNEALRIAPSLAHTQVRIEFPPLEGLQRLEVRNIAGQLVHTATGSGIVLLNVEQWQSGPYTVRSINGVRSRVARFVKE